MAAYQQNTPYCTAPQALSFDTAAAAKAQRLQIEDDAQCGINATHLLRPLCFQYSKAWPHIGDVL